jgi:hypothetical protein
MDDIDNRRATYTEPRCVSEGEALRAKFLGDIERISAQLGDRNKVDADGNRLSGKEYFTWRKNALCALNARRIIVSRLNEWLDAARRRSAVERAHGSGVALSYTTVDAAYRLFMQLAKDDVEFDAMEWKTIEALKQYLDVTCPRAA